MIHVYRLGNKLYYYTTCFGPNGPSSGVSIYTLSTVELQLEFYTVSLKHISHIQPHSFSLPPYFGILTVNMYHYWTC
jgi:hypothetical protein